MIYYHPNCQEISVCDTGGYSWCNGCNGWWCKWRKWCGEKGLSSIGVHSSKRNKSSSSSSSVGSKNSRNLMSTHPMRYIYMVQCWDKIGVVESISYWRYNVNVTYNHLCTDPICYFWVCVSVKNRYDCWNRSLILLLLASESTFLPRNGLLRQQLSLSHVVESRFELLHFRLAVYVYLSFSEDGLPHLSISLL